MKYFEALEAGRSRSLKTKKKCYLIGNDADGYDLTNAPLPGRSAVFENGEHTIIGNKTIEEVKKKEPIKAAAKVAAAKKPVSKKLSAPKVAAIKDEEPESKMDNQANAVVAVKEKKVAKPAAKVAKATKAKPATVKPIKGALPPKHLIDFISKAPRKKDAIIKYMEDRGGSTEVSIRVAIGRLVNHPNISCKDLVYTFK